MDHYVFLARFNNEMTVGTPNFVTDIQSIKVFPNPATQQATVSYRLIERENITIRLFDLQGRMILSALKNERVESGEQRQTISFPPGMAAGTYVLLFSSNKGQMGVKIVKE